MAGYRLYLDSCAISNEIREEPDYAKLNELDQYYQCKQESYDGADQHTDFSSFTIDNH